jgi:rhodanese-related sulfurtransferase
MRQMTPTEVAQWLARLPEDERPVLLDVREPWEVATSALPGSVAIPMGEVPARVVELDRTRPVVCVCHHGMRSMRVAGFLEQQGFGDVVNLAGGIDAWSTDVDPSLPRY